MAESAPLHELEPLFAEAATSIAASGSLEALERLRVKFLGRSSRLADIMRGLGGVPAGGGPAGGKRGEAVKAAGETQLGGRGGGGGGSGAP